jgi:hypothetical protein
MMKTPKALADQAAKVKVIQKEIDWCESAAVGQTKGGELEQVNDAIVADAKDEITRIEGNF